MARCGGCGIAEAPSELGTGTASDPFIFKQGTTYTLRVSVTREGRRDDLTSRTGRAQIRRQAGDVGIPILDLVPTPILPQTGSNRGKAILTIPAALTAPTIVNPVIPGRYVMDIDFTDDGDVITSRTFHILFIEKVSKP